MSAKRNPKAEWTETLRMVHGAKNIAEAMTNLQLCGHYPDDPESQSLYRATCEKFNARDQLRKLEREWQRRDHYTGPQLYTGSAPKPIDFQTEAADQVEEARTRLDKDFSRAIAMPWTRLHGEIGHGLLPEQFWALAADSGMGKTTLVSSAIEQWLRLARKVFMLPLEQGVDTTRLYLAALATGHSVKLVLKNAWDQLPSMAKGEIEGHLLWQEDAGSESLYLHPEGRPRVKDIPAIYKRAAAFGAEVVVIDHIHRIPTRSHDEYADLCATIKEMSKLHKIPTLATAQNHRGQGPGAGDRLKAHLLPMVDRIQGGKVLEQECDVVLGAYRPLMEGLEDDVLRGIRAGAIKVKDYLIPNVVRVAGLKARLEGNAGWTVDLIWDKGRIVDPDDERARNIEEKYDV